MPPREHTPASVPVVIANDRPETLRRIARLVEAAGHRVVACVRDAGAVAETATRSGAELAVVAVDRDSAHALDLVERLHEASPCPVVLVLDGEDPDLVRDALLRGLDAYAGRETPAALQSAIELARHRFAQLGRARPAGLTAEARATRRALIERAKGVLMERHGVGEREAYEMLRGHARNHRITLAATAEAVTTTSGLPAAREP
jgi:response regulator NasT